MMNTNIAAWYEQYSDAVNALSDDIWKHPETGLSNYYAARVTAEFLRQQGFQVQELDAAMQGGTPNCVIAKWGEGKPVIGIIGEFDALPDLGQECVSHRAPKEGPGHGCGHNLMAAGCLASAAALKQAMAEEGLAGTVVYYGCPAEETFQGKALMIHNHLFDDADVCLAWHPIELEPSALELSTSAVLNVVMEFHGRSAHAGKAEEGRSALDAAEITNVCIQYLREHVTGDVKMHHCYLSAGTAPNIVPDHAALNYFIRAARLDTLQAVYERVQKCAKGAAMATETEVTFSIQAAACDSIINFALNQTMYEAALKIPIEYTAEEEAFARELAEEVLGQKVDWELLPTTVKKPTGMVGYYPGSSDMGDVSYQLPTAQFWGHVRPIGLPGHHWNTTALTRHSIGHKGQLYSGKVLAQTGYDLLKHPEALAAAQAEFEQNKRPYHDWLAD